MNDWCSCRRRANRPDSRCEVSPGHLSSSVFFAPHRSGKEKAHKHKQKQFCLARLAPEWAHDFSGLAPDWPKIGPRLALGPNIGKTSILGKNCLFFGHFWPFVAQKKGPKCSFLPGWGRGGSADWPQIIQLKLPFPHCGVQNYHRQQLDDTRLRMFREKLHLHLSF